MTGWIANALIVSSWWFTGEKRRVCFLLAIAGESIWAGKAIAAGMYDLAAICILFCIVAAFNWHKWGAA
jgi:hypothetical protein